MHIYVCIEVDFSVYIGNSFMEKILYSSIKCLEDPVLSGISDFH